MIFADTEEWMGRVFSAYGVTLTAVPSFKYLERILLSTNDNWPAVEPNLQRSRVKWVQMVKVLWRERADRRTASRFYVAVVKAVILFGS